MSITNTTSNQSTVLPAGRSETTKLSMLVSRVTDPVDLGISSDSFVEWIDADDLEELEGGILSDPVTAQDTESLSDATTDPFLSNGLKIPLRFELIHTLRLRLPIRRSLRYLLLPASTSDSDPVHNISLLGTESEPSCLLRSGWSWDTGQDIKLSVLPTPKT